MNEVNGHAAAFPRAVLCAVLASLTLGAVLVGCSAGAQPTGADATPPASSAEAPAGPIPPVRNPKNLAGTVPCLLFTPTQLEANRIDQPGQPKNVLGSPGCEWGDRARTREIRIFVDLGNDVLSNVYAKREAFRVLEVTQVAGYPAIRTKDDVKGTTCYFRVAAAEKQTLVLGFTLLREDRAGLTTASGASKQTTEPCGPAKALAETVIGNLPPLKG
ncbi:MAG TPA: DUF3558 domain-containing protein [Pseudonocardiaceae bacterium]|nr:DUF3558 domain-containing protein [Pseudonocardiaceae bacterium]